MYENDHIMHEITTCAFVIIYDFSGTPLTTITIQSHRLIQRHGINLSHRLIR